MRHFFSATTTHPSLHVSSTERTSPAQQCLDNGFPSVSIKACENGLKEIALASAHTASHSVQALTAEYTRKKRTIQNSKDYSSLPQNQTDTPILASNLFGNWIKK